MGIDDITIDRELYKSLYKDVIVSMKKNSFQIPFEGKNLKNILVAYDKSGKLTKDDKEMLEKLLKACNLTFEDVALVNMNTIENTVAQIVSSLKIQNAILFGISTLIIGLSRADDAEGKVIAQDGCSFLRTVPLKELHQNKTEKNALWLGLKIMFQL